MTEVEIGLVPDKLTTEHAETDQDPDHLAHIVDQRVYDLAAAIINRTAVTALCGHVFVPERNPTDSPVCPRCTELFKRIKTGHFGGSN